MSRVADLDPDSEPLDNLDAKALTTPMAVLPDGPGVQDAEDMEGLPRARPEPRRSALFVNQQFATIHRGYC